MEKKFCEDCGATCYSKEGRCTDCMLARPSTEIKTKRQETNTQIEKIKLTTSFSFTNFDIEDEVGIVTSECVFGMNIFRDFFAGMSDFFGGRSSASQKVLRDARNTCLAELKKEAYEIGADGVMGIDLDYSEISGKGKGMLFLVASGTAVKLKPKTDG
jgi:uncharacterized protein YbjQ (UPF0145 family)